MRFETVDDLVQGIHQEALRSARRFESRSENEFLAWMYTIARRWIAARRVHWFALKRNCGKVFRLTWSGPGAGQSSYRLDPADTATGPSTFAFRRERLVVATKALALLLPRDQDIVRWTTGGMSAQEQAARLGLSHDAALRAQHRALERLRKAYRVVSGHASGG